MTFKSPYKEYPRLLPNPFKIATEEIPYKM